MNASLDALAIDPRSGLIGMLLDDREQVAEQLALGLVELRHRLRPS